MRILALEPFYAGSHRAFLDGWIAHSRHEFTTLTLPGRLWKWRMRHAAITFAEQLETHRGLIFGWDCLFVTDMLNLAEFRGMARPSVGQLPAVAYFHENQFSYPVQEERDRDLHFALTNLTTCLSADAVWFNSAFHRDEFTSALIEFVDRMPEFSPKQVLEVLPAKTSVQWPGVDIPDHLERQETAGPIHIVWVGRWEYDKNPELFFETLYRLNAKGIRFQVSVLGESYTEHPPVFDEAHSRLNEHIRHWGYEEDRSRYLDILRSADIVVSTAIHEFFGIAIIEAIAAGCFPLLPDRLSYPELLANSGDLRRDSYLYDGTEDGLLRNLTKQLAGATNGVSLFKSGREARESISRFYWAKRATEMDDALEMAVRNSARRSGGL